MYRWRFACWQLAVVFICACLGSICSQQGIIALSCSWFAFGATWLCARRRVDCSLVFSEFNEGRICRRRPHMMGNEDELPSQRWRFNRKHSFRVMLGVPCMFAVDVLEFLRQSPLRLGLGDLSPEFLVFSEGSWRGKLEGQLMFEESEIWRDTRVLVFLSRGSNRNAWGIKQPQTNLQTVTGCPLQNVGYSLTSFVEMHFSWRLRGGD